MHDFVKDYVIEQNNGEKGWLMDTCASQSDIRQFNLKKCGHLYGFYNNFFVADIDRWLERDIQKFITHVDNTGFMYRLRWNDLCLQSLATTIFIDKTKVHHFVGWGYGHNSGPYTSLGTYGVFQSGCASKDQLASLNLALENDVGWNAEPYQPVMNNVNGLLTLAGRMTRLRDVRKSVLC